MTRNIASFAEFWPVYLRAHRDPRCRALHYVASACGIAGVVLALVSGSAWWLLGGMAAAYAFAWAGHLFMEQNLPLTFQHPLWSLMADYRMFGLCLAGRLEGHLLAAGARHT